MLRALKWCETMKTREIKTEAEYRTALQEVSQLMESDPAPGTQDGDRLDLIAKLVEAYEQLHYSIHIDPPV